jgi:hypothetical protein
MVAPARTILLGFIPLDENVGEHPDIEMMVQPLLQLLYHLRACREYGTCDAALLAFKLPWKPTTYQEIVEKQGNSGTVAQRQAFGRWLPGPDSNQRPSG